MAVSTFSTTSGISEYRRIGLQDIVTGGRYSKPCPECHYYVKDHRDLLVAEVVVDEAAREESGEAARTSKYYPPRPPIITIPRE